MRIVWFGLIVLFALAGLLFGALNGDALNIDFYAFHLDLPKGAALLCALLLGWIAGGAVVYLGVVLRLRRQLRAARRAAAAPPVAVSPSKALVPVPADAA
jgi:uncharacterized integral membrane protein